MESAAAVDIAAVGLLSLSNASKIIVAVLLTAVVVVAGLVWLKTREPQLGGDFTLSYREQPWTLSEKAKQLNLLYVGYVKCPDICPLSLSNSGQAFKKLNDDEKSKVQLAFISVDAAHDTPTNVADYAENFYSDFIGLTGTELEIKNAIDVFGASFMVEENPKSYLGYSIAHTDRLFFLDKRGNVIDSIANPRSVEEILTKIRGHL